VKYVLDTNVVSALMKGELQVVNRLQKLGHATVCIPQPVLAEIAYGISRLPKSKRREALQLRFDLVRTELARCAWSDEVSDSFGNIKSALEKKGQRIEDFDIAIAAHVGPDDILVSANLDDMIRVPGVTVENWLGK
jgi:tRNA(fMet)-specific endonuclease VapC